MKKTLLALAGLAFALCASAEDPAYLLTFNKDNNQKGANDYVSTWDCVSDGTTWTLQNWNNFNNGGGSAGQSAWTWVRCGRKNNASVATVVNASPFADKIAKVVINANRNQTGDATSAKLYVLPTAATELTGADATFDFTTEWNNLNSNKTAADITVTITSPAENKFYKIVIDNPSYSSNAAFQLNSVSYYADASSSDLLDPELKFPEEAYTTDLESTFVSPKATSLSDGAITYSSSEPGVATVDAETGDVTVVAYGTTVITATIASTETYRAGSASYTLSVVDPNVLLDSPLGSEFTFIDGEFGTNKNVWNHDNTYGLKGTAYSGGIYAVTGIAASPMLDLKNRTEIVLNFQNAFNNYKVNNAMIDVADFEGYAYLVVKEENSEDWVELEDALTAPTAFSWTFYDNDPVSLDAYKGKKIQFGFKYVSTEECAGTWEVKNIKVTAKTASAISEIETEENVAPVYYNLQGVRVANPEKGLYIMVKGNKSQKVIF